MIKRDILGVDTAARISVSVADKLAAEGVKFVGRYLVPESYWKALTAQEANDIRKAGLAILLCWETTANRVKEGAEAGQKDGLQAYTLANRLGVPKGTVIYFAVDYDAQVSDMDTIDDYLRAAQVWADPYRVGVYGHVRVVETMRSINACEYFWQCKAWSGGKVSDHALVYQSHGQKDAEAAALAKKVGVDVDLNCCSNMRAAGLWMPPAVSESQPQEQEGPWYANDMAWGATLGIINDGRPNDAITRAEATTMLRRFAKIYHPGDVKNDVGVGMDEKTDSGLLSED